MKKILLFKIPMSICDFRCHYCYIAQRPVHFQGVCNLSLNLPLTKWQKPFLKRDLVELAL